MPILKLLKFEPGEMGNSLCPKRTVNDHLFDRRHPATSGSLDPRSHRHKAVLSPVALTSTLRRAALWRRLKRVVGRRNDHLGTPGYHAEKISLVPTILSKNSRPISVSICITAFLPVQCVGTTYRGPMSFKASVVVLMMGA